MMGASVDPNLISVIESIREAINRHDLDALATCFAVDYASAFPTHPDRAFGGRDQLRRNWSRIFQAVPDLHAELPRWAAHGDTIWAEWEWSGIFTSGHPFLRRGVTIHGVDHGETTWVRLYMEPVREGDNDIDALEGNHVEIVTGDVEDAATVVQAVAGARIVISAIHGFAGVGASNPKTVDLQGNRALIQAARAQGIERFVLVSIHGAAPDHPIELFRMKYLAEQELQASGLSWTIICPTA